MLGNSVTERIVLAAGFVASLAALFWLITLRAPQETLPRLGFVCALASVEAVLVFCWSASFALVIRKRHWHPRMAAYVGMAFMVPGILLGWPANRFWPYGGGLVSLGLIANLLTRRLAYPGLTKEQLLAPEPPLSLVGK